MGEKPTLELGAEDGISLKPNALVGGELGFVGGEVGGHLDTAFQAEAWGRRQAEPSGAKLVGTNWRPASNASSRACDQLRAASRWVWAVAGIWSAPRW